MATFFIERPVFAWVLAIITMLSGALAITQLPIQQYPTVAPPSVTISASYPGASAKTVENAVTQVIEQRLTAIDNLRYFSASSSNGSMSITLTFEPSTDPDIAQVQTQNKVQGAISQLPSVVQQLGVTVTKSSTSFLMAVGFYSKDDSIDQYDLADLLISKFRDPVSRVQGVGSIRTFGSQKAMRIWLDPTKLYSYSLTPGDVQSAISVQNTDVSAGELGGLPAISGQEINATIQAQSRLQTQADFENIILRVNADGSQVRLRDVARVELGSESYGVIARYRRHPAAGMAVSLASGENALKTIDRVKARVEALKGNLPPGVEVIYPIDNGPFIELSIKSVVQTLLEAIVLVFIVMLLFLQNWRATLIPTIAVPVVLLGTMAVLYTFGFTINVLTMFGLVLAIGLLVDDAIVVVENVERIIHEEGLSPKEATKKSMSQITGALIGIAVVLSTVFIPMAFFPGSAGAIYRQFSVTIVSAMVLSVLVALILSPSLCATFLRKSDHGGLAKTGFFGWFNRTFNKGRDRYQGATQFMANRIARFFVLYALLVGVMAFVFIRLPGAFLPNEDQGFLMVMLNTPTGSTSERTLESVKKAEDHFLAKEQELVEHMFTVTGFNFAGASQSSALGFIRLKDWSYREEPSQSVMSVVGRAFPSLASILDARAFAFFPPPIRELGNASGFDMHLLDVGGAGHEALMNARNQLLGLAAQNPNLVGVRPNGLSDVPQYKIDIDNEKASALGVSLSDINTTLRIAWGSAYVNDFLDEDRIKKVYLQADAQHRMMPDDIDKWYVRNLSGEMVPFGSFASAHWTYGSPKLERFAGVASVNIQGSAAPGVSSGEALTQMQTLVAEQLPPGFEIAWSGLSYEEKAAGSQASVLYAVSILVVFLCLAALYESWAVPFSVILVVPLGVLGAVLSAFLFGLSNDIYLQVAFLTTIGLAAKNAILVVEFAKVLREQQGMPIMEAVSEAAKQRFRPILMTSMAFILGVTPLALANGPGAASQNAIGLTVIGGMLAATFVAIFFVPMFYVLVSKKS